MKPQLYSIVILLLTRINYGEKTSTQNATVSGTQLPLIPTDTTTSVTDVTKAPDNHKTSAPETPVTSVTTAPKGNTTSVTETSSETTVSEIPTEAPSSQAASTPNVSPVRTTKGFTVTTRSGGTPKATGSTSTSTSTSILIGNQTSNPIVAGNATTQPSNTDTTRKTTRLTSTKSTTVSRTSALPVPSLFAIVLLVVSVLCF